MKQNILKLGLVILYVLLSSPLCFGSTWASPPTLCEAKKYEVKITKLQLYHTSGTPGWVTAYTGSSPALDIASGDASQSAGVFLAGLQVPDGTYTKCKVTVSTAFKIRGSSGLYYTTAETLVQLVDGRTVSKASIAGSAAAAIAAAVDCDTLVLDTDINDVVGTGIVEEEFSAVTVTNGNPDHGIRVYFNVSQALEFGYTDDIPIPSVYFFCPCQPTITVERVD